MRWLRSPREWWRLAYAPGGGLVGLTVPARNPQPPVIGYIAVVPEQRGHGYAYDLLAEATRLLIAEGADRIVAGIDVGNTADGSDVGEGRLSRRQSPRRPRLLAGSACWRRWAYRLSSAGSSSRVSFCGFAIA